MSSSSNIEWTDATWNPIVGCSIKSPGCKNCYAMKMARRIELMGTAPHYAGLTDQTKAGPVFNGKLALAPDQILTAPLRWKKPKRIFVNSMGDLFHENAPDEWVDKVFAVMALCPQHQFQVLTKRAERMRAYFLDAKPDRYVAVSAEACRLLADSKIPRLHVPVTEENHAWPLPNVWLGVSAERQQEADERIPHLLQTPAAIRFVSCEPLLGPIDLRAIPRPYDDITVAHDALQGRWHNFPDGRFPGYTLERLNWVIVGGESGPGARPMMIQWVRSLHDQCEAASVKFFFKQWGAHAPDDPTANRTAMRRVGKKAAGRLFDGKEHNGMPG